MQGCFAPPQCLREHQPQNTQDSATQRDGDASTYACSQRSSNLHADRLTEKQRGSKQRHRCATRSRRHRGRIRLHDVVKTKKTETGQQAGWNRTREIGLRMAVGARTRDILGQFLVEAVTLSLIGGLAGIAIGIATAVAIAQFAGWRIVLSPESVLLAVAFAFAIGVFFGFYPARKAARLNPVEALRFE